MSAGRPAEAAGAVPPDPRLTRPLLLVMAMSCGVAVANLYYNQPMLGLIARSFPRAAGWIGLIPTAPQIGYALGLFLLVPLGDLIDRRKLVLGQCAILAVALSAAAAAPSLFALAAALVATGAGASLAQQLIPFAAELAPASESGRVVGLMMSGLVTGILLARTVAGALGALAGWRIMFAIGAGLALVMAAALARALPASRPHVAVSWRRLMVSIGALIEESPTLRRATLIQAALFGAFSAFWATLALFLAGPPFHMGSAVAGLFGVVAAGGATTAPLAGRLADRHGPAAVIRVSILLVLGGFVLMAVWPSLIGLGIGAVLLDIGVQTAMVANQTSVFALSAAARSRLNTVLVTGLFLGGATGSVLGTIAWRVAGWSGVTLAGALFACAAMLVHLRARRAAVPAG